MSASVSVIVPVLDDAHRLELCLAALDAQSYDGDVEVLVIDNGSRDDPGRVVDRHPSARLLHESRASSYAARNTGVAEARGEVLAFTDSDCVPAPDWLERGVQHLVGAPEDVFVGGAVEVYARDPERPTAAELYDLLRAFPQRQYVEQLHFSVTANLLVRRRTFDRVGAFADHLISSGDREWGERAWAAGVRGVYAADVRVRHPSRRSLTEIRTKLERLHNGLAQLRSLRGQTSDVPKLRLLRPPVRSTYRQLSAVRPATLRSKVLFFGAAMLLHYAGAGEAIKVALRQPEPPVPVPPHAGVTENGSN